MKPKNIKRILFFISVFLTGPVILLPVKNRKLSQTELAELRDVKTVQVIIEPVTGSARKVKFPVRETIKKMLVPAGLKYTAEGLSASATKALPLAAASASIISMRNPLFLEAQDCVGINNVIAVRIDSKPVSFFIFSPRRMMSY